MKTIKIPYHTSKNDMEFIEKLQKQFSNSTRFSYNRILEEIPLSQIEKDIKELQNIELMDSWFIRCSTLKAKSILESIKELNKLIEKQNQKHLEKNELDKIKELIIPQKVIFGTKYNFYQRLENKIDKEEYKLNRLMLLNIQGELNQKGNRKFEFDIDNNQIKFKANRENHIILNLPKLRKNIFRELRFIQEHKILFSVELGKGNIHISFDEAQINKKEYKKIENRILGIDLNPNFIGYSIQDISENNEKQEIISTNCYDLNELNEKLNVKSSDKKQQYQNNKRNYEILQIAKDIITQAIHFKVEKIVIEELNIQTGNNKKRKQFNRLVNNIWNRNLLIKKLKMLCNVFGIKLIEVNPCYSSFIGNLQYQYFDPVNSSLEIGRRGKDKYVKGSNLFPSLRVKDLWKKHLTKEISDWKSLYKKFENENIRYRVSLDESSKFSRCNYRKKCINLYFFI